jgi:hypothetical protein
MAANGNLYFYSRLIVEGVFFFWGLFKARE